MVVGVFCWTSNPIGSEVSCENGTGHVRYTMGESRVWSTESNLPSRAKNSYCAHTQGDKVNIASYIGNAYIKHGWAGVDGGDEGGGGWNGPGYILGAEDSSQPQPPNFVVNWTKLKTPWGVETYVYGLDESVDTSAQSQNTGDGSCSSKSDIVGHFYLSKGYNEDPHSGSGAWRRLDSTTTHCSNLGPKQTNTETKNTRLRDWISEPGIYNVVYCIDHPRDDHNNGGDYPEKHESDNCSTEAVFEVREGTVNVAPPPPNPDFVPHSLSAGAVYTGDKANISYWVHNQGNKDASTDTYTAIEIFNNSWITMAEPNKVRRDHATAGYDHGEAVTTNPVNLPLGTYSWRVRVDHDNRVAESNEDNNIATGSIVVLPRPKPVLSMTRASDDRGCCTTNTGEYVYPKVWVRNDGPAAPEGNVRVLYQISSNGTGGAWWTIGYGTIEPRELRPGDTDEDRMDGERWRIPKGKAWEKQWHTIRACVNIQGGEPTCGAGDSIASYGRYSKK